MSKIVVIIPIYNAEKYIKKCISSVLAQTVACNIQIVLVDDGSTDESGEICDKYAAEHENVYVIHKSNGGAASARNTGIDFAFKNCNFDYIAFVDSDDVIHPQMYEKLVELIENNDADVASCQYKFIPEDSSVEFEYIDDVTTDEILYGNSALENFTSVCGSVSIISPCMRLCKKDLLKDIRFVEGYIDEDSMLLPYLLQKTKKWVRTNRIMYFWVERQGSVTRSGFTEKNLNGIVSCYIQAIFFQKTKFEKMKKYFSKRFMNCCVHYYCNAKHYGFEKEFSKYRKLYNKNWFKYFFTSDFCFNEYLMHLCFRLHIPYGEKIYKKLNPDWLCER